MFNNPALRTLTVVNSLFVMAGLALVPIYAIFAEEIGATVFIISALAATELVSRLAGTLLLRFVGDDIKEQEYMLVISYLLRAVAWGSLIFVGSIAPLFVIQVVLGFGDAIGTPSFMAVFAKHLDDGRQIAEYADYTFVRNLFGALGTLGGGLLVTHFGFAVLFLNMAIVASACAVYIYIQPRQLL